MGNAAARTADATVSAHGAVAVVTSDTTVIPTTRGLYIGATGNLKVTMADGTVVVFASVPVGILPVQVQIVWAASTTASSIIALY